MINQIHGARRVAGNMTYSQVMYCICATYILASINIFMLAKGIIFISLPDLLWSLNQDGMLIEKSCRKIQFVVLSNGIAYGPYWPSSIYAHH